MNIAESPASSVRSIHLFSGFSEEDVDQIENATRKVSVAKRELVLKRGERLDGLFGVLGGKLKIYLLSCDGHERIIRILSPGDSFGEAIMFNDIKSPVYVEALSSCELLYINKNSIFDLLKDNPAFVNKMLKSMSFLLQEFITDLETSCLQGALQRIAYYICENCREGCDDVELPSTKANVASLLNLTAESFSRGLHKLAENGLITTSRRSIIIKQPEALQQVARGDVADLISDQA